MNEQIDKKSSPIAILGMHRSGTSCLAGSLQEAGIYLGDVVTSAAHNQKGNRENLSLCSLNDDVLGYSGGAWNEPPASCQWTREHQVQRDSLMKSFQESTRRWGFKDPRTLGTLTFWQDSTTPFQWVGTYRHPLCVAKSLIKRQPNFSMTEALNLWRDYNERLLALYEKEAFPLVNFSVTTEDYIAQLKKVFEELDINVGSNMFTPRFFDETLRHHSVKEKDSASVPDEYMEVYYKLEQCRRATVVDTPSKPTLSVIVNVYNMQREAPRTLVRPRLWYQCLS